MKCAYCSKLFVRKNYRQTFCSVQCRKKDRTKKLDTKAIAALYLKGWGMDRVAGYFNVPVNQVRACLELESVSIRHKKYVGTKICAQCEKPIQSPNSKKHFCSDRCHDINVTKYLDVNAIANAYEETGSKLKVAAQFKTTAYRVGAALRIKNA